MLRERVVLGGGEGAGFWLLWFYFGVCFPVPGPGRWCLHVAACSESPFLVPCRRWETAFLPLIWASILDLIWRFSAPLAGLLPPVHLLHQLSSAGPSSLFPGEHFSSFPSSPNFLPDFAVPFHPASTTDFCPGAPGSMDPGAHREGQGHAEVQSGQHLKGKKLLCVFFFWKGYNYLPLPSYSEGFGVRRFDLAFTAARRPLGLLELTLC